METTFNTKGFVIEFYQKEGDTKYSFRVKDDEPLTTALLANVNTKRVKEKDIPYALKGITNVLLQIDNGSIACNDPDAISQLNEYCQKSFNGSSFTTTHNTKGPSATPTITLVLTLPNGKSYTGQGMRLRVAKSLAAQKALADL